MAAPRKYPEELRERAVRLVLESGRPIAHVARDLGVHKEALLGCVRQVEADTGRRRELLSSEERLELKRLPKDNAELKRANAILKDASVYFATELDPIRRRDPLCGRAKGRLRGRARLSCDRGAGEHVLRAQIPEAVPPRACRSRTDQGAPCCSCRLPPRLRRPQDLEGAEASRHRGRPQSRRSADAGRGARRRRRGKRSAPRSSTRLRVERARDLLQRDFAATPNERSVADITYLRTWMMANGLRVDTCPLDHGFARMSRSIGRPKKERRPFSPSVWPHKDSPPGRFGLAA